MVISALLLVHKLCLRKGHEAHKIKQENLSCLKLYGEVYRLA